MICNKKAYEDLREDCETCSERGACFSGHAVGVALAQPILQDLAQPLLRETVSINVGGVMTTVYKDEIEKEFHKALQIPPAMMYGA